MKRLALFFTVLAVVLLAIAMYQAAQRVMVEATPVLNSGDKK